MTAVSLRQLLHFAKQCRALTLRLFGQKILDHGLRTAGQRLIPGSLEAGEHGAAGFRSSFPLARFVSRLAHPLVLEGGPGSGIVGVGWLGTVKLRRLY